MNPLTPSRGRRRGRLPASRPPIPNELLDQNPRYCQICKHWTLPSAWSRVSQSRCDPCVVLHRQDSKARRDRRRSRSSSSADAGSPDRTGPATLASLIEAGPHEAVLFDLQSHLELQFAQEPVLAPLVTVVALLRPVWILLIHSQYQALIHSSLNPSVLNAPFAT